MDNEQNPKPRPTPPDTFFGEQPGASPRAEGEWGQPSHQAPNEPYGQAYGQSDTRPIWDQTSPAGIPPVPPASQAPDRRPGRGRRAGLVLASLALAAVAGFGGAALYDQVDDDAPAQQGVNTSRVIDQGASTAPDGSVEAVAADVLSSVVRIDVSTSQGAGSGSGIILSSDGQILTNEHVISGAGEGASIRVSFADGTRTTATVLGSDPLTDTAVIKAEDVSGLTPATIGQSGNLKVGQQVVAIGSPFGLDATVTSGIVSALGRPVNVGSADTDGNSTTYPAIQTDAAINPGNSGGPLVDLTGRVVGINSSIRSTSSAGESGSIGLGFAIPIDEILPIVEQMKAGETPTHARLGITVSDPEPGQDGAIGALVREVSEDAAAGSAGLETGDVIIRIDDNLVDGRDDLVATVRGYRPGDEVDVTFVRDGEEQTVSLKLDSDAS